MGICIALAGNPNSGKTTLFNALTGSNQFVGNWPGVTVEKKEGKYRGDKSVTIADLPGIYSLSPYTLEEVVARNYLVDERPNAILNIVDGTNLERNLYLTTQLVEMGIPVVIAINMMDVVEKNGDRINIKELSKKMGTPVVEISALKGTGITSAANKAIEIARAGKATRPQHSYSGSVEHALAHIEELVLHDMDENLQRWYAIKLFERDQKIQEKLGLSQEIIDHIEKDIVSCEDELDDDAESIITGERYNYIGSMIHDCIKKANRAMTTSDKIDRIVTNRVLALPIFAVVMFLVYYIAMVTVGAAATDWTNDNLFGDGFHLFGIGSSAYEAVDEEYSGAKEIVDGFVSYGQEQGLVADAIADALDDEAEEYDAAEASAAADTLLTLFDTGDEAVYELEDEETLATEEVTAGYDELAESVAVMASYDFEAPDPADYGVWVPSIPDAIAAGLEAVNCADWLEGLIIDGIVAGVGAVLGFVPQMLVLFFLLAFLESCGYMARIAFIMDRVFRKFGLSGKSFIPMLIGTGCGVPGIMASRTIENDRDRKMTIMTTTFIPCSAKTPFIAMIAGAIFGGSPWVATSAYFIGIASIICSGIILKKTRAFSGDPAPFVMELPAYHWPTVGTLLRSTWERGWSFIKKAGTIILLSTIFVWFTSFFGWIDGHFGMLSEEQIGNSILATIGNAICWIFIPQGWGNWQATVASITGLVAKENIVGTLGILYSLGEGTVYHTMAAAFTAASGLSFMIFNLLCAPCFAAMGAIKREMNNSKWFWGAIGYQCGFAYVVSLVVYQIGHLFEGGSFGFGTVIAFVLILAFIYLLFRKQPEHVLRQGRSAVGAASGR
jgi:ferrous iron transport protein B